MKGIRIVNNANMNEANDQSLKSLEEDCCGNGCNPCILDVYKKMLNEWNKGKQKGNERFPQNVLSQLRYSTFLVAEINKSSEDCILIKLNYKGEIDSDTSLLLDPGQYVILHCWSMSRSFTPIAWTDKSLLILVKIYTSGKFTTYLKNIKIGDEIDVRGPYGEFLYKSNNFQKIIMFSIGSGIAALYPIAKAIIDNEAEETKIHLVAGFRSVLHIPLKKELQSLSDYWNFTCTLYLSQESDNDNIFEPHGINIKFGKLAKQSVYDILTCDCPETTLILICGTSQFNKSIEDWAKAKNYTYVRTFE